MGIIIEGPKDFAVEFELPTSPTFWAHVGEEAATQIMQRTQAGQDVDDHSFKPYTQSYAKWKRKKYGHSTVNLHLSGNMLNALARGVRSGRGYAKVFLSGNEGGKAWSLEKGGREFMGLSNRRLLKVFKLIDDEIARKNKL